MANTELRIGCQGWAYDDWISPAAGPPIFYPASTRSEQMLEIYTRAFDTVEVDSTLYAIPSEASVINWNKRTPGEFRFAFKFPREVTHDLMFHGESARVLAEFCDRLRPLGQKLECILIQTPESFEANNENFNAISSFVDQLPDDIRFAVEFRNRAWLANEVIELLRSNRVSTALVQGEWLNDRDIRWLAANLTANFVYVRWMGPRDLTKFDRVQRPRDENLGRWAQLIEYLAERTDAIYAYFSNFYEGQAVASANKLKGLLKIEIVDAATFDDQMQLF